MQQAAARENKDNKEVKERAERARAAKAEREGAAATAQAYKSALGLTAKPDWGAAKPKAALAGAALPPHCSLSRGPAACCAQRLRAPAEQMQQRQACHWPLHCPGHHTPPGGLLGASGCRMSHGPAARVPQRSWC